MKVRQGIFWLALSWVATCVPVYSCCSLGPASFSATKGLAAESKRNGKLVHLLAYQNAVANLSKAKSSGNAMFLPIPAKPGTMTSENIVDTSSAKNFLNDMERSITPVSRNAMLQAGGAPDRSSNSVIVFEHDIYTIVLAQNAKDIPAALARVPEAKRPAMNNAIFDAYAKWYPGWTFALCCFNNKEEATAAPMLWWYEPNNPTELFFPGLDAHTGGVPKLNEFVDVDHALAVSVPGIKKASQVLYSERNRSDEVKSLLPARVVGNILGGSIKQGDFAWKKTDVKAGRPIALRVLPPGAAGKHVIGKVSDLVSIRPASERKR